ncbi:hypothetical protein [Streptococcus sp. DD13]|uniref:hypothetical protein n=1 Tax=Streptococcus sp. DD13 TaxID=1777881 RepID=UPI000798C6B4|nr:hypothetical protein [Streptococcus sp. DD13]KXT77721.1 hypothetical protein STRDD13_01401 [Streptococcus sp. DD13]
MGKVAIKTALLTDSQTTINEIAVTGQYGRRAVDDTTREPLEKCRKLLQENAGKLVGVVSHYNSFLTNLAKKFEENDKELSKQFGMTVALQKSSPRYKKALDRTRSDDYFS